MIVKLMTEHHLEFLSVKGGCRGLSESTQVKMAHILFRFSVHVLYLSGGQVYSISSATGLAVAAVGVVEVGPAVQIVGRCGLGIN